MRCRSVDDSFTAIPGAASFVTMTLLPRLDGSCRLRLNVERSAPGGRRDQPTEPAESSDHSPAELFAALPVSPDHQMLRRLTAEPIARKTLSCNVIPQPRGVSSHESAHQIRAAVPSAYIHGPVAAAAILMVASRS
jgi:hypothetical protein